MLMDSNFQVRSMVGCTLQGEQPKRQLESSQWVQVNNKNNLTRFYTYPHNVAELSSNILNSHNLLQLMELGAKEDFLNQSTIIGNLSFKQVKFYFLFKDLYEHVHYLNQISILIYSQVQNLLYLRQVYNLSCLYHNQSLEIQLENIYFFLLLLQWKMSKNMINYQYSFLIQHPLTIQEDSLFYFDEIISLIVSLKISTYLFLISFIDLDVETTLAIACKTPSLQQNVPGKFAERWTSKRKYE
ncbi:unnamed protein product [Paramecium octaurelia]|uniref:Uncharacterized protein n=1 Tax=Paramecium octaurelia TaxID=43137 RepID=A0A8S1SZA9_PAROT|nr:unnamed protein product [Paramecium octaurelia]